MEMMEVKPGVRVAVVEGHDREGERRERERDDDSKNRGELIFVIFGLQFLHAQAMISTPIYKGGKG